ncbi:MAG: N-acetylmuramoyl-L-alanine amidase, partial [Bacteroidia bacterium]|nr:N-acetylmuramoyl-L-alanine amidase [Bacteroidia bacterium]MDW8333801.1 N-acetylmuramoyl-L-alanine amidase [Bacteroidia bacterium]
MPNLLKYLIIHCTASPPNGATQTGADVVRLHRNIFRWSRVGYRCVVRVDGVVDRLVPANLDCFVQDEEVTWGAGPINAVSHHVCYIGGVDERGIVADTRTAAQKQALAEIIRFYVEKVCPEVK